VTGDAALATYVGVDRRQRRPVSLPRVRRRELGWFALALLIVGFAIPTALAATDFETAVHAQTVLRMVWAMLFVSAGVLRLVRWRLTGESRIGLIGCGLFSYGVLASSTPTLGALLHGDDREVWLSPETRTVAALVLLTLLARAFLSQPVDAGLRPFREIAVGLTAAYGTIAVFVSAFRTGHPITLPASGWFVIGGLLSLAWLATATWALTQGFRDDNASMVWIGLGLTVLAAAQLLHALALVATTNTAFYGTGLNLVVAAIAAGNAARDLSASLSRDGTALLHMRDTLERTERLLSAEEQQQHDRLHDARSLIAALKMASLTLDRYDERLEQAVKHRLRSSLITELSRLEEVIDGRRRVPLEVFQLDGALTPLVTAERAAGTVIRSSLRSVRVLGRPVELATVVQQLLTDARRRAPSHAVRLFAVRTPDGVQLVIEDRAPGMRPEDREQVFHRDFQAGAEASDGLGLYLARRLMREQGGDITFEERHGGGSRFVLSLLAAPDEQTLEAS
jgi:signal transduction histidine kinase